MEHKYNSEIVHIISRLLNLHPFQVKNTIDLLNEGATIPFISRYRKEKTGSLDEVQVASIRDQKEKFEEIEKRKETILATIEAQGQLTRELKQRIDACHDATGLEDIYLPYKPKRHTRAMIARENGLEPLSDLLMLQFEKNVTARASQYLNDQVKTPEEALAGARDILAERISEDEQARNTVRRIFGQSAVIRSQVVKGKEEEGAKYRDYFSWEEPLKKCPSHRLLAMRRGEREGFLRVSVNTGIPDPAGHLLSLFVKGKGASSDQVEIAVRESFTRLISPSIENEFARISKEKADREAITVFAENLRQLLLAPPAGPLRTLAIDPGFRTGCKVVCLNEQGDLLHNETIYPHPPVNNKLQAAKKITSMVEAYRIEAIAIGNGTAGRETEHFIKKLRYDHEIKVFVVSEDGASVYSASPVAREEFPQYDVTVRGAVSIGRRLMDPLAELVKIDPKSIGVGQYQHDVDQKLLKDSLDTVVESAVNSVGINLNTSSRQLLSYVSGLGPGLARNVVDFRTENGPFKSRFELLRVPRLGPRSFEQCAGFLRIPDSENPLDNSAVHPEAYPVVEKMAQSMNCSLHDLPGNDQLLNRIDLNGFITENAGLPTLTDILNELKKPGRDPRKTARIFEFAEGIYRIEELVPGMILPGIVSNITRFGVFVDIGIKQAGLVHLSELADRFVDDPGEVVKLHQHVRVKVLEIDIPRNRIRLSLKQAEY